MTNLTIGSDRSFRLTRRHDSVLAGLEKRCLVRMAERLPAWVQPDHLTLLAFASMILAGAACALARMVPSALLAAIACIAINWFGDSLDGTLARVRKQERPRYGYYVDHIADSLGAVFLFGGLALSGLISGSTAMAMLLGYLLLAINAYLAAYALGVFELSFWKVGPTELRILLAAALLFAWIKPEASLFGASGLFLDLAGAAAALTMIVALFASVMMNTWKLRRRGE